MSVANQYKSVRVELNLSQARVSSETGISRSYLSEFEGGKRVLSDSDMESLELYYLNEGADPENLLADYSLEVASSEPGSLTLCDGILCASNPEPDNLEELALIMSQAESEVEKILLTNVPLEESGFFGSQLRIDDEELEKLHQILLMKLATAHLAAMAMQGRSLAKLVSGSDDVENQLLADHLLESGVELKQLAA